MKAFLYDVAKYLYNGYGTRLAECALVFPNRRAGLFLTRYLSELTGRPLWIPSIYTISDLMEEQGGVHPADPVTLNFELYRVYLSVTQSSESIDSFYNWGEILMADFDETDKYLVDAGRLFRNAAELKNIENEFSYLTPEQVEAVKSFWSGFSPHPHSPQQKEFLHIWESLTDIYRRFRDHLAGNGLAYEGMIYRKVAEDIQSGNEPDFPCEKYFIIGFNALNSCEKVLFDHLRDSGKAEFFWDYDDLYIEQPSHQAGFFMRENIKRYPGAPFCNESGQPASERPEITVIAAPGNTGQAKLLEKYRRLFEYDEPFRTAVILPDESLMMPVLSSLPDSVNSINITMGYPLKDSSLFGFVMQLLSLHRNRRDTAGGQVMFYHDDVSGLLGNQFFITGEGLDQEAILRIIREQNLFYIGEDLLNSSEFGKLVFSKAPTGTDFTSYLLDVLDHMAENFSERKEDPGNTPLPAIEFVYGMYTGINRLRDILLRAGIKTGFDTLIKLIRKVLSPARIPFYGEPLGGVQVMGVLETRALDFENVIWLSMNEGVFPARQYSLSFIPYSLRRGWGLPVMEHRDAVYAWYFYRTLHRARKVVLIYNTREEGLVSGEMSRFIYQLKYGRTFQLKEKSLVFSLLSARTGSIKIAKSKDVLEKLKRFTTLDGDGKFLSPTAVNSYLDCSLRFYFRYIAGLREPGQVRDELDLPVFGNLLHEAVHNIYKPYEGKTLSAACIDNILADQELLDRVVDKAFEKVFITTGERAGDGSGGRNFIISRVLQTYLRQLLVRDRELVPFRVMGLERGFQGMREINTPDGEKVVRLGGTIDRLDEVNGAIRVVDYKTGGDEASFSGLSSLFERGSPKRRRAVFQTFLYSWLYIRDAGPHLPVSPVLYQVKKLFGGDPFVITESEGRKNRKTVDDFTPYLDEFDEGLKVLLEEMFDPDRSFEQAEDEEICKFCPYRKICHR